MTSFPLFNLYVPQHLRMQYEKISQEIIELDQQDRVLASQDIDQLCQKVHAFARSAIDSPIFSSGGFNEDEIEGGLNPPYSKELGFRSTMECWKRLASIIPLTTGADHYLRSRYLMASLEFQQRLNQNDPVTQALVQLQQRRLSLHSLLPASLPGMMAISPTSSESLSSATSSLLFSSSSDSSFDEAYIRVCSLFSSCTLALSPYVFSDYWDRYCRGLSEEEKTRFLSALLYRFYLNDLDIPSTKVSTAVHPMEVFCWQILAENITETSLTDILSRLSFEQKARLACLALAHYREGSFFIVKSLKQIGEPEIIELIRLCQREQLNCASIAKELQSLTHLNANSLHEFIGNYESALVKKAEDMFSRMQKLLPLIFTLHESRKEGHFAMQKQYGLPEPSAEELAATNAEYSREAETIASLFPFSQTFSTQTLNPPPFDQGDFLRLLRTFGYGHLALPPGFGVSPHLPFLDALDALILVYSTPLSSYKIHPTAFHAQLNYLSNLLSHVQALKSPFGYAQGASTTIFSLPTYGKDLSRLSWLPSMAENLRDYCQSTGSNIQDFPIFVFDQSARELFLRNASYIDSLNSLYGTRIFVYSNEQILTLSKKLNLGQLIDTSKEGRLGYGGARNAVYMLSPLLKELDRQGLRTPEAILNVSSDLLRQIFFKTVSHNLWTIHMGDDDAQIPYGYFLSDLLLAQNYHGRSFVKCGEFSGRDTTSVNGIHFEELFDLEKILSSPEILFEQTLWTKDKRRWGMCGALRSFGWSMLPFGNEEAYNQEELIIGPDIRPAGFHLAGRRFPQEQFPSSPIIGIAKRLRNFLPYMLETVMVVDLFDTGNKHQRTILPWKKTGMSPQPFANLGSVFETLSSHETEKAMRTQLLKNYWEQHKNPTFLSLFRSLSLIASHDINGSINSYLQTHPQASHAEMQELEECRLVFEGFQRDSEAFFLFNRTFFSQFPASSSSDAGIDELAEQSIDWNDLLKGCKRKVEEILGKPISSFPMTRSLLLALETIAGGELRENVTHVLHLDEPIEPLVKRRHPGSQQEQGPL
ncbi:MAG: hypothetical protein JSR39_03920 [Verrucomicrobia bacterium]|nr:hypothetical protein [Verrucomicrobiota bacterium]